MSRHPTNLWHRIAVRAVLVGGFWLMGWLGGTREHPGAWVLLALVGTLAAAVFVSWKWP